MEERRELYYLFILFFSVYLGLIFMSVSLEASPKLFDQKEFLSLEKPVWEQRIILKQEVLSALTKSHSHGDPLVGLLSGLKQGSFKPTALARK